MLGFVVTRGVEIITITIVIFIIIILLNELLLLLLVLLLSSIATIIIINCCCCYLVLLLGLLRATCSGKVAMYSRAIIINYHCAWCCLASRSNLLLRLIGRNIWHY